MDLPQDVIEFLTDSARLNGTQKLSPADDLFSTGTLDSFALVDFISVLEQSCGITVPDAEVLPANFRTIETITTYVDARRALSA